MLNLFKLSGRTLAQLCGRLRVSAKVGEDRPEALFEIDHGPKPGQRSGRVRWLFLMPRGKEMIREALLLAEAREEKKRQRSATKGIGKALSVRPNWMGRSAQNERTLCVQKDSSEGPSEALSSTQKQQREKTNPESLKEKSGKELKEKDSDELTRFVNNWNAICTECNDPTLAWLPTDVKRLATRLVEVIRQLGIAEMPDEELSKRLRLLCGKRSRTVFQRMGNAFSVFNLDGLAIKTFANFGPKVWRAVEAELTEVSAQEVRSKVLSELPPSPAKIQQPLDIDRELERLTINWEKACLERNQPDLVWGTEQIAEYSHGLGCFIKWNRLNTFSDDELRPHLCDIVETIAARRNSSPEYITDQPPPIRTFVSHGNFLFAHSVRSQVTHTQPVAIMSDATDAGA